MNEANHRPIPQAFYACMNEFCAEQISYPPDMLYWMEDGGESGWLCDSCWHEHDWNSEETPPKGISLQDEIERQNKSKRGGRKP